MRTTAVLPAILIALVTLSTPTPAARAQAPSPKFEQIAALIAQKMAEYGVPGVAFGVLKDGQLLTRGFGVTNLDDGSCLASGFRTRPTAAPSRSRTC
jgi:CubicO group peptidase (beta-lactamase class C family)